MALIAALAMAATESLATDLTWQGGNGGGTSDWNVKQNWSPNSANGGPTLSDNVFFGTSAYTGVTNTAASTARSVTFSSGANSFTLAGTSTLTMGSGGITNNSSVSQSFLVPIILNTAETWNAGSAAGGSLAFSGTITNAGFLLTIGGANNTAISGIISGTGGLTKSGVGTLTLSRTNTYTGGTTVSAGTLKLGASNVLADTGALIMNGGTFANSGYSDTLGALTNQSSSTIALGTNTTGTLTFASGSYVAGTLTITNWTGTAGVSGTANRIFITAAPSATFLTNINFTGYQSGAIRLGTGEIVPSGPAPTKLAITSVNGGSSPTVGTAFSVVVQSQDAIGNAANVLSNTAVTLSVNTGSGTLGGTVTGTITAGTNSVTISGVTYNRAEGGVILTATRTSGDSLTAGNSSSFTVNPAPVTVSSGLTANNKVYDGTTTATITSNNVVLSGVIAGDTNNVKLSTNGYSASFASATVGSGKTVTVSGLTLTGSAATNYTLTQPSLSANITAVTLTVTANDTNRVYGAANPSFTASYSGFIGSENESVLSGSPSFSTPATTASSVGGSPYSIIVTNGTLSATNYTFAFVNGQLTITRASTISAVSTSANPSPTGSNVTFTVTLTAVAPGSGTPTATVQFLADGSPIGSPATLSGGVASLATNSLSHGTHTITAQYAGDGNFLGSTNTLSPNQIINTAPTAVSDNLQRYPTSGAKGRVAALLANDTDADGDSLTLSSVSATSAQGGAVVASNLWVFYTPPGGFTNSDSFSYVATDGGLQATGSVAITIVSDLNPSQNVLLTEDLGNGDFRTRFLGIPGRAYTVQYTTNLVTPSWQALGTAAADATGLFEFTDTPATNSPPRFYRSTYP